MAASGTPSNRERLALAIGDLIAISVFVVLGEIRHDIEILGQPRHVLGTGVPFLIGWIVVSLLLGTYSVNVFESARASIRRVVPAWIGAALIGVGLRATALFHGDFAVAFLIVSVLVGLVFLILWRALYAGRSRIGALLGRVRTRVVGPGGRG